MHEHLDPLSFQPRTATMSFNLDHPLFYNGITFPEVIAFAREQLKRFTYKPGWSFEIVPNGHSWAAGGGYVWITVEVEDTYHPGQKVAVGAATPLTHLCHGADPEWFARGLARAIQALEIHESQEWLRRDGEIYDDPHAGQ